MTSGAPIRSRPVTPIILPHAACRQAAPAWTSVGAQRAWASVIRANDDRHWNPFYGESGQNRCTLFSLPVPLSFQARSESVASRLRNALLIIVFVLLLIWTIWPIVSVSVAGSIASANGCQLDEGSVHPCVVRGADMGETLYTMGMMGWFMLVTVPTGGLGLLRAGGDRADHLGRFQGQAGAGSGSRPEPGPESIRHRTLPRQMARCRRAEAPLCLRCCI